MKKSYLLEYEDESSESKISFEYDENIEEALKVKFENGVPVVYANKTGLKLLGDTLTKMHFSNYTEGFHIHMREDFEADGPEVLRIVITE